MAISIAISVATVLGAAAVSLLLRRRHRLLTVPPEILFLDLTRSGSPYVDEDARLIGPHFGEVLRSNDEILMCGVLFLYADFAPDAKILGRTESFREIVRRSGAKIVVVAVPHGEAFYTNAARDRGMVRANVVFTMDRADAGFARFFSALFSRMRSGMQMHDAWASLVPQHRETPSSAEPKTIFLSELGPVRFAN